MMFRRLLGAGCAASVLTLAAPALASDRFVFNAHWGGVGVVAGRHSESPCHGPSHFNMAVTVALTGSHLGHGPHTVNGTLHCTRAFIGPTTGSSPEPRGGLSIRCAAHQRPIDGGAGFHLTSDTAVSQHSGGFGYNHDGYWHYTFLNASTHSTEMSFWAVCVDR